MHYKNILGNKKIIISIAIVVAVLLLAVCLFFIFPIKEKTLVGPVAIQNVKNGLDASQIMEIIKTDKDYNELSGFIKGFNPEVIKYIKLGPNEYKTLKPIWQNEGFADRIKIVDKIKLTDFCYWIEIKNKNDETRGLRIILDTKENKSLLLIASLSISTGISM